MKPPDGRITRAFARLLRLYPRAFRERFEEEMLQDFTDMAAEAQAGGAMRLARFLFTELRDLGVSAVRLYFKEDEMSQASRAGMRAGAAFGLAFMVMTAVESLFSTMTNGHGPLLLQRFALLLERLMPQGAWAAMTWYGTGLVFGAACAGAMLAVMFSDLRRVRTYLLATLACWALPMAAFRSIWLLWPHLVDIPGELFLMALRLVLGMSFGVLFLWITRERKHALRLLAGAAAAYFVISQAVRAMAPLIPFHQPFSVDWAWNLAVGGVFMALEGAVTGAVLGALAGLPLGRVQEA